MREGVCGSLGGSRELRTGLHKKKRMGKSVPFHYGERSKKVGGVYPLSFSHPYGGGGGG